MVRPKKSYYGRKFSNNQYTKSKDNAINVRNTLVSSTLPVPNLTHSECTPSAPSVSKPRPHSPSPVSASKRKLSYLDEAIPEHGNNIQSCNVVIDVELISEFLKANVKCKYCDGENCVELFEDISKRRGLASKLDILCKECHESSSSYTSKRTRQSLYEVNIRYAYGLRSIGKGKAAGQTLAAVMNLPKPPTRFANYNRVVGKHLEEVCNASMRNAVKEAVEENSNDPKTNLSVALDGTWHKRGHTSLNGVVTATSVDTGKVMDFDCLTKYCPGCKGKTCSLDTCIKNFEGPSGGMESAGAVNIFNRSVQKYGAKYVNYLGDGDSKGFKKVVDSEPYGSELTVEKLECVGHVQKRMGSRLHRLLKEKKGQKLSDGKVLSGKGRLSHSEIDTIQNYYGAAIRRNANNLEGMRKDVWAIFFHKLSTDSDPQHGLCPKGASSWCKYNRSLVDGTIYSHKHSLPVAIMNEIKPIFKDLSNEILLKKCLHGQTQNCNECVNSVIWTRLPKTVFVGADTLKMGVNDAVMCYNDGNVSKLKLFENMGIVPGTNSIEGLRDLDRARVRDAQIATEQMEKKARMRKRNLKRKKEDEEDIDNPEYSAGMH